MTKGHRALRFLPILFGTMLGCAALSGEPACPEPAVQGFVAVPVDGVKPSCTEARLGPEELSARAIAELESGNLEMGYRYLALIHIRYPDSGQDREAFPLAARVFRKNHLRHRTEMGSVWVTTEPQFMFGWLAQFFQAADASLQAALNAMFEGMHYGMFRDFLTYAKAHAEDRPELSCFTLSVEEDNGIIQWVTAGPAQRPGLEPARCRSGRTGA